MPINCAPNIRRAKRCGTILILLALLTSAPSFGQSLAIFGDKDAVGGAISHSFSDFYSSTTVAVGISNKRTYVYAIGYSIGSNNGGKIGFSMAMYPISVKHPFGFGLLAGLISSIGDRDTSPIASLGFQTYLSQQTTNKYLLVGISRLVHKVLQASTEPASFTSTSIAAELGLIHPTQLRPSIEFAMTRFDPQVGTVYSISLGIRIPFESER